LAREKVEVLKFLALMLLAMLALVQVTREANSQQGPQQDPQSTSPSESSAFSRVESLGDGTRAFFMFRTTSHGYTIRADGFAERSGVGKGRPANFSLRVGGKGRLVRLYFLEHESDLLLIYEASDKQFGWGYVVRLNQKTLKTKWTVPVSDFNLVRASWKTIRCTFQPQTYWPGLIFAPEHMFAAGRCAKEIRTLARRLSVADNKRRSGVLP
jgi:hypothetical protein